MTNINFDDLQLEEACPRCKGSRRVMSKLKNPTKHRRYEEVVCPSCGGQGQFLTSNGRQLLNFVAKHFNIPHGF